MNGNRKTAWLGLMMVAAGACCLADLSATAAETPGSNASAAKAAAEHAPATGNLLRNAGFELDSVFNGSPMRQGTESHAEPWPFSRSVARRRRARAGGSKGIRRRRFAGVERSPLRLRAIRLAPPEGERVSLVSAPEVPVPAGPLALSAWVRTAGAKALLELQLVAAGARSDQDPRALRSLSRRQIALPENTAQWSRVTLTTDAPVGAAAVVRLVVERGRVVADDLQLEAGRVPTPFGVRAGRAAQARIRGDARVTASLLDGGRRYAAKTAGAQRFRRRDRRRPGDLGRPLVATEKPEAGRIEERLAEGRGRGNDPAAAGPLETGRLRRGRRSLPATANCCWTGRKWSIRRSRSAAACRAAS